jgi:hypothetical protein
MTGTSIVPLGERRLTVDLKQIAMFVRYADLPRQMFII